MVDGVKIKELPRITSSSIGNTDLMAIELSDDTYSISIGELLVIFSADSKIISIKNEFNKSLTTLETQLTEAIQSLERTIDIMNTQIQSNEDWQNEAKQQILKIQKDIVTLSDKLANQRDDIDTINDTIDRMSTMIADNLNSINELIEITRDHALFIDDIQDHLEDNDAVIDSIDQVLDEYIDTTNKTIAELQKTDKDNKSDLKKLINEKYDDIMKYIDYYHHYIATPPNFDEPYYYERELAGYCYPIHSLYHTTDDNWDPQNYKVPGDWILRTTTTLDGDIVEYIYERIN